LRTRSPDVNNRTEVGVGSLGVSNGGGTDGDGNTNTSGGNIGGVCVVVTSADDGGDPGFDEVDGSAVEGRGSTSTQAQRGDSRTTPAIARNPVYPRDNISVATGARVVENLNCDNAGTLGNTAVLISVFCEKGEIVARTKGQKQQFLHSGFRDRSHLGSRIRSVDRPRAYEWGITHGIATYHNQPPTRGDQKCLVNV